MNGQSEAISSLGIKFYRWSASSNWQELGDITGVDGPKKTKETIDVTPLNADDKYRQFIGDLKSGGTVSLTMNFVRSNYDLLDEDFEASAPQNYAVVFPDTKRTAIEFEGLVLELPITGNVGSQITSNVSIQVSGKPVTSDGSSGAFPE